MFPFGKKRKLTALCAKIVDFSQDGVVLVNHDHNIVYYNDGARRIFGYSSEEVLGKHLDLLIPTRFHLQHDLRIEEFGAGQSAAKHMGHRSNQTFGLRKDGSEFVCSIGILKLGTKSERYYAAVIRDISENKRTEEELLRLAATDPLTGAFNRREFTAVADREALRAQRYHHPLSILMLDLDHFKKLNDTYGHAAGDKALQRFTTLCCNALRNADIFGRWGGEEFVALLPETPAAGAAIIAERLREMVADTVINFNDHKINFTVSIGIAQYRDGETSVDEPLSRADAAVYDAKKAGRNQISVHRG
jgi:diguanylate cyclase (GGDEF)-like protein/PAS domain S-box-containing protein